MEDHGKCGLLHHGKAWQEYAAQHTEKEAINAAIFNVAIGNSIKLQTAHSLRRRKVKLYANPVGYVQYILIAQLLKYGNSHETAS